MRVGIIGAGKVGSAMAVLLPRKDWQVVAVASRSRQSARRLAERLGVAVLPAREAAAGADLLFITTGDDAIAGVAGQLAAEGGFHQGQLVIQMSGALTSEVLAPAAKQGAITLSLHPIQSFASVEQAIELIPGSYFSIEGDSRGRPEAERLVESVGGKWFLLEPQAKVLYHAAACEACNYLVALLAASMRLLEAAGVPEEMRLPAFLPLVEGTLHNIKTLGITKALTGPIARGDRGTVASHLAALQKMPERLDLYTTLGRAALEVAQARGSLDREQAGEIRRLLAGAAMGSRVPPAPGGDQDDSSR